MQENTDRNLGKSSEEIISECMVISAVESTALAIESGPELGRLLAEIDEARFAGELVTPDEAVAMVSTWKRQWFATPGVRVLYLIPQAWTDASIPLTVSPAPEELVRDWAHVGQSS